MQIKQLRLKNFRCFENQTFDFQSSFVLIEGRNGSGKSSLLEAIHYACFLRSFRTHLSRELAAFDSEHFFIAVDLEEEGGGQNQIQVGFEKQKNTKLVKLNKKPISSYREIIDNFRVVTSSEEDLELVKSSPEVRRNFLNQSLFLENVDFAAQNRKYKQILSNRNGFFANNPNLFEKSKMDELGVWSKQLWDASMEIKKSRVEYLSLLEKKINKLLGKYYKSIFEIKLEYLPKNYFGNKFESFWPSYKEKKVATELKLSRSLFGAHLDDFAIHLSNKKARFYASRGQQKLIIFLIKIAQLQLLEKKGKPACILLDDFLTDFDKNILNLCLDVLKDLKSQVFITTPLKSIFNFDDKEQVQEISLK